MNMGWANLYIEKLKNDEIIKFRPKGTSMTGRVNNGALCTVAPTSPELVDVGDIVLCSVKGKQFLHLVKAKQGNRFLIGNNKGHINGWVGENSIYGKLILIEP
jgi:hypothetical protein